MSTRPSHPLGIFPINGASDGRQKILGPDSRLRLRLPADRLGESLVLIGAALELDGATLRLGSPEIHPVAAMPRLFSAWVTYSKVQEPDVLLERVARDLEKRGIGGRASLVVPRQCQAGRSTGYVRRTRRIRQANIAGFALLVEGLTPEASLALCRKGLGGRRHFGGSLFLPARDR